MEGYRGPTNNLMVVDEMVVEVSHLIDAVEQEPEEPLLMNRTYDDSGDDDKELRKLMPTLMMAIVTRS